MQTDLASQSKRQGEIKYVTDLIAMPQNCLQKHAQHSTDVTNVHLTASTTLRKRLEYRHRTRSKQPLPILSAYCLGTIRRGYKECCA